MTSDDAADGLFRTLARGTTKEKCDAISELLELLPHHENVDTIGQALADALADSDPLVRAEAAEALAEPELFASHSALVTSLLRDTDATVRACAAESLGDVGYAVAAPALESALDDPNNAVRGYAAASLGLVGSHASMGRLLARLDTERESSRFDMLGAVLRLHGDQEYLDKFLTELRAVSEEDALRAMNVLDDLLARSVPRVLSNEPRLRIILTFLQQQLDSVHNGHINELLDRLPPS